MLLTILLFILLLGVLVLVHEWGHFIVARIFGVRVEEFAFGFPPRLFSVVRGRTRYALNLLPLGGYVKIFGEGGEDEMLPESFASRPLRQRFLIIAAGVGMNFILAWLLFSLSHGIGLPTAIGDEVGGQGVEVTVIGVNPGSPAEQAGVRFGDGISELKVKSEKLKVETIEDVQRFIDSHRGEEIEIMAKRGKNELTFLARPRPEPPSGQGPLGIAMARISLVRSPWWRAPWDGVVSTIRATAIIVVGLGRLLAELFSTGRVLEDIAGPVGIFALAGQSWELGLVYFLELSAVLSVNLAVLNILPIPALDGGRVAFLFIEKLRGIKIDQRFEQAAHSVGLVLLLGILAAITYRDIVRIF